VSFLSSGDSLYVLNDSPSGWRCAEARRTVGIEQYEHDPKDEHGGFASWNDFSPGASRTASVRWHPRATTSAGAIAEFALAAIPQPHDPKAPLMLVRSKLAVASTAV
jgi:hypothetical protein